MTDDERLEGYTIERGIPLPPRKSEIRTWGLAGALRAMKPKESVFTKKHLNDACRAASRIGALTGAKFTCRMVDGGTRIWRVS